MCLESCLYICFMTEEEEDEDKEKEIEERWEYEQAISTFAGTACCRNVSIALTFAGIAC